MSFDLVRPYESCGDCDRPFGSGARAGPRGLKPAARQERSARPTIRNAREGRARVDHMARADPMARLGHPRRTRLVTFLIPYALLSSSACSRREEPPPPPIPLVTVANPVRREVVEWDEYTGHVDAVDFVEVRARVSGLIVSAPFQSGAIVSKGDLLVEIDARPFQAELDSRRAEVARSEALVQLAEIEVRRIQNLPPGSATPIERDRTEAALSEARAVLAAAKAAVELARLNVEWCSVTAPIGGRISNRFVDPGNLITGGGGSATLLTTIASIDPMYVRIDADERAVLKYQRLARERKRPHARENQIPFYLQLADETTYSREGVIDFVDNRIDPATGTLRARGVLPNPGGWLTPGFFARIRVPGCEPYQATLIPGAAVFTDQDQKRLFVVNAQDVVEARAVRLGTAFGELRAIEEGVGPEDRVIINGIMQVRPGSKVRTQEGSIPLDSLPSMPAYPQNHSPSSSAGGAPASGQGDGG